jgi:hypothetical protein
MFRRKCAYTLAAGREGEDGDERGKRKVGEVDERVAVSKAFSQAAAVSRLPLLLCL